jgi:hypothetical protein
VKAGQVAVDSQFQREVTNSAAFGSRSLGDLVGGRGEIPLESVLLERGRLVSNSAKWSEYFSNVISEERDKAADEKQKRDDQADAFRKRKDDARKGAEDALSEIVCPMMQAFARQFPNCVGPRDGRKDDVFTCSIEIPRPGEGRPSLGVEVTLAVDKDCELSISVKATFQAPGHGRAERLQEVPPQPLPSDVENWLQEKLGSIAKRFVQLGA